MTYTIHVSGRDVEAIRAGRHVEALASGGDARPSVVLGLVGCLFPAHAGGGGPIPVRLLPGQVTDLAENGTVDGRSLEYQFDYRLVLMV